MTSIGQALMQGATARLLIVPLQFGLGIQLHHQFGSLNVIDSLNRLGFCAWG